MQPLRCIFIVCITASAIGSVVLAQSLTNKAVFEMESIKVVANEKFPADLECEILVGPKGSPYFRTEGKQNQIKAARIEFVVPGPVVSVIRREGKDNPYALSLFSEDAEGKAFALYDLNLDGVWDVRKCATRKQQMIFTGNRWVEVIKINGLLSATPTAEGQGIKYEFKGTWTPVK